MLTDIPANKVLPAYFEPEGGNVSPEVGKFYQTIWHYIPDESSESP
jgi:hypothetical protein